MTSLTAAHPTLPILLCPRHQHPERQVADRPRHDRGPYHGNRLIDVSNKAAELLEFKQNGCPGTSTMSAGS